MNGRKREEKREKREKSGERNSERSELRPPDTSTLPPPSTLPTLLIQTSLNNTNNTIFYIIQITIQNTSLSTISNTSLQNTYFNVYFITPYTIYSNTTIFSFLLSSSSSTECTLEAEHTTPFSFTFGTIGIICPM